MLARVSQIRPNSAVALDSLGRLVLVPRRYPPLAALKVGSIIEFEPWPTAKIDGITKPFPFYARSARILDEADAESRWLASFAPAETRA
jgi:hypothetical protein